MLYLSRFEIEIQRDDRPCFRMRMLELRLNNGLDFREEIRFERRFIATRVKVMREYRMRSTSVCIAVPHQVLLNADWCSGGQSTIDPVGPLPVIRITVMCVDYRSCSGNKIVLG